MNELKRRLESLCAQFHAVSSQPLIVGMTGHRHIHEAVRDVIRQKVEAFFVALCQAWKKRCDGKSVPIFVLNGMAEGADQLVAQSVCTLRDFRTNTECEALHMVAVTPMPLVFYRQDFDTPQLLEQFEGALHRADAVIELPLLPENSARIATDSGTKIRKMPQYELLGKSLAQNVSLLLALWDGQDGDSPTPGGTGDVVRLTLENLTTSPWRDEADFWGVFHILTPRRGAKRSEIETAGGTQMLRPK